MKQLNFWLILCIWHFCANVILPTIVMPSPSIDVIEAIYWGSEFQTGYYKHPPLFCWIIGLWNIIFGKGVFWCYLLAQISLLGSFFIFYNFLQKFQTKQNAMLIILICELFPMYNFKSWIWNADTVLLPAWILGLISYHNFIENNNTKNAILLGLSLGFCMLGKYFSAFFCLFIGLHYLIFHKGLKCPTFFLAVLISFVTFSPNLLWLYKNNFVSVKYIFEVTSEKTAKVNPIELILCEFILPLLIIFLTLKKGMKVTFKNRFRIQDFHCWFFLLLPAFISLFILVFWISGDIRFFTPCYIYIPSFLIILSGIEIKNETLIKITKVIFIVLFLIYTARVINLFQRKKDHHLTNYKELSIQVLQKWHEKCGTKKLEFLLGNTRDAGGVAMFIPNKTHVIPLGNFSFAQYANEQECKQKGSISIYQKIPIKFENFEVLSIKKHYKNSSNDFYIQINC